MLRKNTLANFLMLLIRGQRVDWQYSLIMMLIIGGLICTPLILGSIRNRAYEVHKREVEISANAREVQVSGTGERSKAVFDDALVAKLGAAEPGSFALGNFTFVISAQGPGSYTQIPRANALVRNDPRIQVFDIVIAAPEGLGFKDVVLSDSLGWTLYGREAWDAAWAGGRFQGPPLRLFFNDTELPGEFRVVGRQKRGKESFYFSQQLGAELRSFSDGLGSLVLKLPPSRDLVQNRLPKLATGACMVRLPAADVCPEEARQGLRRDLLGRQHVLAEGSPVDTFLAPDQGASVTVQMMERSDRPGTAEYMPAIANCRDLIWPVIAKRCSQAAAMQIATARVSLLAPGSEAGVPTEIFGLSPEMLALMQPQLNIDAGATAAIVPKSLDEGGIVQLVVPASSGLALGASAEIVAGSVPVRGLVSATYRCEGACLTFADIESTFRLANLVDGLAEPISTDPFLLRPKHSKVEYDEMLVYASSVDGVPALKSKLKSLLRSDGTVKINYSAINAINRDNARLSAVFLVTGVFALVFLFLSLSALSKINIDRRNRQMAQLLIMGVSRWFVRWLVLCEYLVITAFSAGFAFLVSYSLCSALRALILGGYLGEMPDDASFKRVVNAMDIDPGMFGLIAGSVIVCSSIVAAVVARYASRADPIDLLD